MNRRLSRRCAFIGIATIVVGCGVSVALRNPGGAPVSVDQERFATVIAYVAFGIGAFIAIVIPAGSMRLRDPGCSNASNNPSRNPLPWG